MTTPCTKAECGPELGIPSRVCWDGSTAGPVCERNAKTNVCGYVITQCPPQPTCKLSDCGPEPYGVPNGTCKDGSISGPVCKPTSCGTCGWTIVSCP